MKYILIDYYTGKAWQGIEKVFNSHIDALQYAKEYKKDLPVSNMFIIKPL